MLDSHGMKCEMLKTQKKKQNAKITQIAQKPKMLNSHRIAPKMPTDIMR